MEKTMRRYLVLLTAATAMSLFAPASSMAQGVEVGVPGVGVRVGEPRHERWREERFEHRGWREHDRFRDRDVGLRFRRHDRDFDRHRHFDRDRD